MAVALALLSGLVCGSQPAGSMMVVVLRVFAHLSGLMAAGIVVVEAHTAVYTQIAEPVDRYVCLVSIIPLNHLARFYSKTCGFQAAATTVRGPDGCLIPSSSWLLATKLISAKCCC